MESSIATEGSHPRQRGEDPEGASLQAAAAAVNDRITASAASQHTSAATTHNATAGSQSIERSEHNPEHLERTAASGADATTDRRELATETVDRQKH